MAGVPVQNFGFFCPILDFLFFDRWRFQRAAITGIRRHLMETFTKQKMIADPQNGGPGQVKSDFGGHPRSIGQYSRPHAEIDIEAAGREWFTGPVVAEVDGQYSRPQAEIDIEAFGRE